MTTTTLRNLDDICIAISALDLNDSAQIAILQNLVKTYFDAMHNPPFGVIGVGAITYAEQALIAAQNGGAN